MKKELIDKILPCNLTIDDVEKKYSSRPNGQWVTRFAPSPTGYMHIGGVLTSILTERLSHSNGGICYLRIEDTDQKREVKESVKIISDTLDYLGIKFDEGVGIGGNYGPYTQSERIDIYKAYVRKLLLEDKAYPSFLTTEELGKIREEQTKLKLRTGIYGHWANERNMTEEQIEYNLEQGKRFVINFKSNGDYKNKCVVNDLIKGKRILPENDLDIVILKSDGLPTYHFAHVIDDHLMGTTHVNRTDEWFISTPLHLQLFDAMGWTPPNYLQPAPLQKIDGNSKRKLSKRKDPEADFRYYMEQGYPKEAIVDYIMNLLNSNYEDWRKNNVGVSYTEFPFDYKKVSESGALLDFVKLDNIAKNFIATLSADVLYDKLRDWAENFNQELFLKLKQYKEKFISILEIERKDTDRVRKDYAKFSEIWKEVLYFFEFTPIKDDKNKTIIKDYIESYNENWTKEEWFSDMKTMAVKYGYALNNKEFIQGTHVGLLSDFIAIFRIKITGKKNTPDLYGIMKVLGKNEVIERLKY
ncbi:MAG: glutamate--tRNA ligase [Rickettsiales bacterium]|jgi:glutamyl-tRNA synthetase|nr:glutamate--tRNA ligase [Rickettsiales bacterium]